MQLETRRYLERIEAVDAFIDARTAFLSTWPKVAQLQGNLNTAKAAIIAAATSQSSESGGGSAQVTLKQTLIEALSEDMRAMSRTAKQIDLEIPGTSSNFVYPSSGAELSLIGAARVFLQNATVPALKAQFIGYGMPTDFLDDLQADINSYDAFVAAQTTAQQAASTALKGLDDAIAQSRLAVDGLDALLRNIYLKNPSETAAWKDAKRLRDVKAHRAAPVAKTP